MREAYGDIWTKHGQGAWIAITTNGSLNAYGLAVMGRGVAKAAVVLHPELPRKLGAVLKGLPADWSGTERTVRALPVTAFPELKIMAFPTKWAWYQPASEQLIELSCGKLMAQLDALAIPEIYLVRPGCGNGRLEWAGVQPLIAPLLDDRVVIIEKTRR